MYKSLRSFVPSACVFVVLFPLVGGKIGPGLFLLPLLFALQIVMNVGIALLVSTFVTLVPDGTNVMNYVTRILFFATPVIYPVGLLPASAARSSSRGNRSSRSSRATRRCSAAPFRASRR